jgi:hypothetical protein
LPLGHWENFRIENNKLLADVVIDGKSELELTYIRKIENGDIKGATIGADPIKWNTQGDVLICELCSLFEISLEALPGNLNALALKKDNQIIKLSNENAQLVLPQLNQTTNMKQIALKLGLSESATEGEIINAIGSIQLKQTQADSFVQQVLKGADKDLNEEQKGIFIELSKTSPEKALQFIALNKKAEEVSDEVSDDDENDEQEGTAVTKKAKVKKDISLSSLIKQNNGKQPEPGASDKTCYDYLQKHNSIELSRIHKDEPKKYAKLAADYQNGIRYKE